MDKFFPEESLVFKEAIQSIVDKRVAVLGHQRPDGDCIGSTVALVRILRDLGIDAVGYNQDAVPRNLVSFVGDTPLHGGELLDTAGRIAMSVDCADFKRVGLSLNDEFPTVHLNIDHHLSNRLYADRNIIVSDACATGELLAGIFFDCGYTIDSITAQALYVGIATDTGQFRFPSTTCKTFEIARRLCELGADPAAAAFSLYEQESFAKIKLLQHFLDSLQLEFDGRVCVGTIADGVYERLGATIDDSEGLVDYARAIEGVEIGVLIEDRKGALKGSLRANDAHHRVDEIAKRFGGGGHACAAGLNVEASSIDEFYPQLMQAIGEHLKKSAPPA